MHRMVSSSTKWRWKAAQMEISFAVERGWRKILIIPTSLWVVFPFPLEIIKYSRKMRFCFFVCNFHLQQEWITGMNKRCTRVMEKFWIFLLLFYFYSHSPAFKTWENLFRMGFLLSPPRNFFPVAMCVCWLL